MIEAPISGDPSAASVTVPDTWTFCATAAKDSNAAIATRINFFIDRF
jgi:hypothetical protein